MIKRLFTACKQGDLKMVQDIMEIGVDFKLGCNNFVVIIAAENGHLDILKCLYDNNADLQYRDSSALINATMNGKTEVVEYLMAHPRLILRETRDCAVHMAKLFGHNDLAKYIKSKCRFYIKLGECL